MRLLTLEEGAIVIGTDPQEWADSLTEFIAFLEAQMTEGETVRLEAGAEPRCFEEGTVGWVADWYTPTGPWACLTKRLSGADFRHASSTQLR